MFKLLTTDNYKTKKGEAQGYFTAVLHLAPHNVSGSNMCPRASAGCSAACLNTAGKGVNPNIQTSRITRTRMYLDDNETFMAKLLWDLKALARKAGREGMRPAVRLNATSDQPKLAIKMAEQFPEIQFYDYTKIREVFDWDLPANYYPTFSRSETNGKDCLDLLERGHNVAVVFSQRPDTYRGVEVINGDLSDLRFLDKRGVVVGLTAKGKGKQDTTGFVVGLPMAAKEEKNMAFIDESGPDFTAEDRGKYQPPEIEGDHSYAELREMVLAAIDDDNRRGREVTENDLPIISGFRTLPRIKAHAGLDAKFDLNIVIEAMLVDYDIRRCENGTCTAYFRYDQFPARFWLNGDGTVGAVLDEKFKPSAKLKEMTPEEIAKVKAARKGTGTLALGGRKYIDIDANVLKGLYAMHGTNKLVAKALDMGESKLSVKLSQMPSLRDAAAEGRQAFLNANPPAKKTPAAVPVAETRSETPIEPKKEKTMQTATAPARKPENVHAKSDGHHSRVRIDLDENQVFEASRKGENLKAVAALCNIGQAAFSRKLKADKDLRREYDRGREEYFAANGKGKTSRYGADLPAPIDNVKRSGGGRPGSGRQKTAIDLKTLEDLTAQLGSKSRVAPKLGIDVSTLYTRLKEADIAAAYERGLARFAGEKEEKPEPRKARHVELKASIVESDASNEVEKEATPAPIEAKSPATRGILSRPPFVTETKERVPIRDGDRRGRSEIETGRGIDARVRGPIERFSDGQKTRPVVHALVIEALDTMHWANVPFNDGSKLVVGFDGNLFDMSVKERAFLDRVVTITQLGPMGCEIEAEPKRRTFMDRVRAFFA